MTVGVVVAWVVLFFAYRQATRKANKTWKDNQEKMNAVIQKAYQQGAADIAKKFEELAKASHSPLQGLPSAKELQTPPHQRPELLKSRHPKK